MTWAELLRRSAKYARKSLEQISEALRQPVGPHASPSVEPAYSRYRRHGPPIKPFRGPQSRNFSTSSPFMRRRRHFFRGNVRRCPHFDRIHRTVRSVLMRLRSLRQLAAPSAAGFAVPAKSSMDLHLPAVSRILHELGMRGSVLETARGGARGGVNERAFLSSEAARIPALAQRSFVSISSSFFTQTHSFKRNNIVSVPEFQQHFSSVQNYLRANDSAYKSFFGLYAYAQVQSAPLLNLKDRLLVAPRLSAFQLLKLVHRSFEPELSADHRVRNALSALPTYRYSNNEPFVTVVDFDIAPRLTIPSVSELTDEALDSVSGSLDAYSERLGAVKADITKLAELGPLPLSVEALGTTLRVHFPNCDSERVQTLLEDKEVRGGHIVDVVNPAVASDALETASEFSSGVSDVEEVWTQISGGPPSLTMGESTSYDSGSLIYSQAY